MRKAYRFTIIGTVERSVIVGADSLESAKSTAEAEWAALTGGIVETAEIVSAEEMEPEKGGLNNVSTNND